jgi:nitroreductase
VRKRLDLERPVSRALIRECLGLALQAPTGSNGQFWHFLVVDEPEKKAGLAEIYRRAWSVYPELPYAAHNIHKHDPSMQAVQERVVSSAEYLAENLERVPVLVIPALLGRFEGQPNFAQASLYGSILPAAWSFMLAARERGLGTCWTTLHLMHEKEAAELLGVPYEQVTQVALIPVAHTRGTDFRPGPRKDLDGFLHWNAW